MMESISNSKFIQRKRKNTLTLGSVAFIFFIRSTMSFSLVSRTLSFSSSYLINSGLQWRTPASRNLHILSSSKYGRQKISDSTFYDEEIPQRRDFTSGRRERNYEVDDQFWSPSERETARKERDGGWDQRNSRGPSPRGGVREFRRGGHSQRGRDHRRGGSASYQSQRGRESRGPVRGSGYERYGREKNEDSNVVKAEEGSDYVYGINPILNALKSQKRSIQKIFVQEGIDSGNKKDKGAVEQIMALSEELRLECVQLDKHNLNFLSDNRPHQGFILQAKPLEFQKLDVLPPETEQKVWLALDEVWDPQNFGALLRSAHFFGVDGVITCAKNSAKLTPTVSKASAGACEAMDVYSANNMMRFLDGSKKNGWQVIGLSLSPESKPLGELKFDKPTILVLGNEGHGLRTNILRQCETLCKIQGMVDASVDSLNVSVTGGIILNHFLSQR